MKMSYGRVFKNSIYKSMVFHILTVGLALIIPGVTFGSGLDTPSGSAFASGSGLEMTRLDEEGYLYYMDYTGDYYSSDVIESMRKAGIIESGCSSFMTYNTEGEPISCRNYDVSHRVSKEDRTFTGLNVVIHCKPEGKYESIAVGDAVWCAPDDPNMIAGGPENEAFDISKLDVLPYECLDGINEKGLFVAVHMLDIKEGDEPGKIAAGSTILLRYLLDDCANVEEAVTKIGNTIVTPEDWQGNHLFITDSEGNHVVIESRNGEVTVTESDIITNFYLSYDDAEDCYRKGELREGAAELTDENGEKLYHFGYGHGYNRFITIASQLNRYLDPEYDTYRTRMPESSALVILQSVAQNMYTQKTGVSWTQYSAVYNNSKKTLHIWSFQNYDTCYTFDLHGNRE